nr:MAG TPA: hypothetical protein [Caudoviricetes sp.]
MTSRSEKKDGNKQTRQSLRLRVIFAPLLDHVVRLAPPRDQDSSPTPLRALD